MRVVRSFVDAIRIEFLHSSSVKAKTLKGRIENMQMVRGAELQQIEFP